MVVMKISFDVEGSTEFDFKVRKTSTSLISDIDSLDEFGLTTSAKI